MKLEEYFYKLQGPLKLEPSKILSHFISKKLFY